MTATRSWPRSARPARAGLQPAPRRLLTGMPERLPRSPLCPPGRVDRQGRRAGAPHTRVGGRPLSDSAGEPLPPPAPPRLRTAPLNSVEVTGGFAPGQPSSRGLSQSFSRRVPPCGQSERKALEAGGQPS